MLAVTQKFPPPIEAQFRASRIAALAAINVATFRRVALLVMVFSIWDWFVDPVNWKTAFVIRCSGTLVILLCGGLQKWTGNLEWATAFARVRFAAAVAAVAGALAVLDQGYIVGLAGLVAALLSSSYIAIDRRELLVLNAAPLLIIAIIVYAAGLNRFAVLNTATFVALAIAMSMLLGRVFDAANRRAFLLEQELIREARTDTLTGLHNRRALEEFAEAAFKRAARSGEPCAVVLCDIDHFKNINDEYGHDAGDVVIRAVGEVLSGTAREADALGRWGGEEFLAVLPDTTDEAAMSLAERMRLAVEASMVDLPPNVSVTISLGVASIAPSQDNSGAWKHILKAADGALYRAKLEGRNRVARAVAA